MDKTARNTPFLLSPAVKDYLWGGTRLKSDYNKHYDIEPLAETWECSAHPDGASVVASGTYKDMTLPEVLKRHPEYLGTKYAERGELPILVKLIDAAKPLSVQVHPDDDYAAKYENGSLGKTEMWYVLHAEPGAKLVRGFRRDVTEDEVRRGIESGTLEELLNYVPVKAGDSFLIHAGTVHAIGAGLIIAEIQENSNLTYRLYDYNRRGKDGKLRELHIDKALQVSRLKPVDRSDDSQNANEDLVDCKYFRVRKLELNDDTAILKETDSSFAALLCVDGTAVADCANERLDIRKGDCAFIPAHSGDIRLSGTADVLEIAC